MDYITESEDKIPVTREVNVAVAGGGVSGVFAALAAARHGASTMILDRFGSLGGNIGPGMCTAGSMLFSHGKMKDGVPMKWVLGGVCGIPREFAERFRSMGGGGGPGRPVHHLRDPQIASYLISLMMTEGNVEVMLSTFVANPILEDGVVKGVFIENKSGRQAIVADVTVDATGEADLVRRAKAPVIYPKESYFEMDGHAPNGVGLWCFVGGVNWEEYDEFVEDQGEATEQEEEWSRESFTWVYPSHLLPLLRESWKGGGYSPLADIDGIAKVRSWVPKIRKDEDGLAGFKIQLDRPHGHVNVGDGWHISKLEAGIRSFCHETTEFWRRHVPGFQNSFPVSVSPFLGNRGGPCIEGDYVLTAEDCKAGTRFDDVVYIYGESRALRYTCKELGECKWVDVPYRVMLPKGIDGLIAVGRSASCIPDTLLRNRVGLMHMGQVGGTAAAMCAERGVQPRQLDVRELQKELLASGFHLGDDDRLAELGLAGQT